MNVLVVMFLIESKNCYECETYKAKNNKLLKAFKVLQIEKVNSMIC